MEQRLSKFRYFTKLRYVVRNPCSTSRKCSQADCRHLIGVSKMNVKKAILLFATLLGIVALSFFLTPSDKKLTDRFILYGKVSNVTKSNNHSFGIIGFDVDSIVNGRIDTIRTEVGTPFKIDNSYAEVYAAIPIGAELASRIKVDVPEKTVFLMEGDSILFKSDIYIQTDKQNLEFIRKNSRIVDNKIK